MKFLLRTALIALAGFTAYRLYQNKVLPFSNQSGQDFIIPPDFQLQGHRGARGLVPENTIPSFLKCLELGVNAFEFDVVISRDKQVLVSHEAWFNPDITTKPDGNPMQAGEEKNYLFYQMPYEEIRQFDCGQRGNPKFIQQKPQPAHKPLLSEVIQACEDYIADHYLSPVTYNIEIKTHENGDGVYQPKPETFARLVLEVIEKAGVQNQCIVQSFDPRIVQALNKLTDDVPLSLLVDNFLTMEQNLSNLGFVPDYYAPHYKLIGKNTISKAHQKGMKVITWTVNDLDIMQDLIQQGIDIIITDYPDLKETLYNRMVL